MDLAGISDRSRLPYTLKRHQQYKLAFSLLSFFLAIGLFIYYGSIDSFAPYQVAIINHVAESGSVPKARDSLSAFYVFGAVLMHLTGVQSQSLLSLPVQMAPFFLILFVLIYRFSNSIWFATGIVIIEMFLGVTGTSRYFLWPHGIGNVLIYISLLLMIRSYDGSKIAFRRYLLLLFIAGVVIIGMSYNYTAIFFAALATLIGGGIVAKQRFGASAIECRRLKGITRLNMALVVVLLGIFPFIYSVFIPMMASSNPEVGTIDKFLNSYFSGGSTPEALSVMILPSVPSILTYLSLIKYVLISVALSIFTIEIVGDYWNGQPFSGEDVTLGALITASLVFILLRVPIGNVAIEWLYLPGILCLAWLYQRQSIFRGNSYRTFAIIALVILLLVTPTQYVINYQHDRIDRSASNFEYLEEPAEWHSSHASGGNTLSDELTRGYFLMYATENTGRDFSSYDDRLYRIPVDDVGTLTQQTNDPLSGEYYVLNKRLNVLEIGNWITLRSWEEADEELRGNKSVERVYDNDEVIIYRNSQDSSQE